MSLDSIPCEFQEAKNFRDPLPEKLGNVTTKRICSVNSFTQL